jgi:pimeloyl-ACP methyl ester carboxylesterase
MDVLPMIERPTAPVVFLMHGRNFPSSYWQRVIVNLSARGYRVIVPDQIGFNKSSKAEMPYSFSFWADNTAALAKMLKVKSAIVVAHSIGGIMATTLAAEHPGLVSRLILEDPLGLEDYRVLVPEVTNDFLFEREIKLTPDEYREQLKAAYFPVWKPEYEIFVTIRARLAKDKKYPQWVRAYIQSYQLLHKTPISQTLMSLDMPIAIIVGERDTNAPGKAYAPEAVRSQLGHNPDLAVALAPKLKKGTTVTLPGLGHVPHLDDVTAFDGALEKALA